MHPAPPPAVSEDSSSSDEDDVLALPGPGASPAARPPFVTQTSVWTLPDGTNTRIGARRARRGPGLLGAGDMARAVTAAVAAAVASCVGVVTEPPGHRLPRPEEGDTSELAVHYRRLRALVEDYEGRDARARRRALVAGTAAAGAGAHGDSDPNPSAFDGGPDEPPFGSFETRARQHELARHEATKGPPASMIDVVVNGVLRRDGGVEQEFEIVAGERVAARSLAHADEVIEGEVTTLNPASMLPELGIPVGSIDLTTKPGHRFPQGVYRVCLKALGSHVRRNVIIRSRGRAPTPRTLLVARLVRGAAARHRMDAMVEQYHRDHLEAQEMERQEGWPWTPP